MNAGLHICRMAASFHLFRIVAILFAWSASIGVHAEPAPDPFELCGPWIESRAWSAHAANPKAHLISDGLACYDGTIEPDSFDELNNWIDKAKTHSALVIRSGGGDANVALNLAEKLQAKNARVYVLDICASSCANFIYAGVRERHVQDGALILFHGGFSRETRARAMASLNALLAGPQGTLIKDHESSRRSARQSYDSAWARQDALYRRIGVNPLIVHGVDAIDFRDIDDFNCGGASQLPRNFVYFDRVQMKQLGIAPSTGFPQITPTHVNEAIEALERQFVACLAPPEIFETDEQ